MGPMLSTVFEEQGATVVASQDDLSMPDASARVVLAAGEIDILVVNLAFAAPTTPAVEVSEAQWRQAFAAYLCSPAADCFVGQVFPVCGGWVAR